MLGFESFDEGFERLQPLVMLHLEPQGIIYPGAERQSLTAPCGGCPCRQQICVDRGA